MEPNASKHAEEQNIICPVVELNRFIWIILNNAGIQAKWNIIKNNYNNNFKMVMVN